MPTCVGVKSSARTPAIRADAPHRDVVVPVDQPADTGMGRVPRVGVSELVLVRHGESTANVAREQAELSGAEVIAVECRDADVPLSQLGFTQAQAVGRWLAGQAADAAPAMAWSSPYLRARATARTALDTWASLGGPEIGLRVDERLRDKELGILDTLTMAGILARFPAEAERRRWLGKFYYRAPGGESWADLALRIRSFVMDLDRIADGQRVILFTHDAMVQLFRYVCQGLDEQALLELASANPIGNASITRLVQSDAGSWSIAEFNSHDHLVMGVRDLRTEHGGGQPDPHEAIPQATPDTSVPVPFVAAPSAS